MAKKRSDGLDDLTGVPGNESFRRGLSEGLAVAEGEGACLSVAMVDIDFFKKINDEEGAAVGDAVLKAVADHLAVAVEEKGTVYRRGGDEFALLMPGVEKEEAFLLLEEARRTFEGARDLQVGGEKVSLQVSVSVGLASYPDDGAGDQELVRKADDAVFRAKSGGRNKVCLARDERMVTKTSHYTQGQLERLSKLSGEEGVGDAMLLREALDDLLRKYESRGRNGHRRHGGRARAGAKRREGGRGRGGRRAGADGSPAEAGSDAPARKGRGRGRRRDGKA